MDIPLLRKPFDFVFSVLAKVGRSVAFWRRDEDSASPEGKVVEIGQELSRSGGDLRVVEDRLAELDHEWGADRTLQVVAGVVGLVGAGMAARGQRSGLGVAAISTVLLVRNASPRGSHSSDGLRMPGLRSTSEIEQECYALKALQGDFSNIPTDAEAAPEDIARAAWRAAAPR